MIEMIVGLGIIFFVLAFVFGVMLIAEEGIKFPRWLKLVAYLVVAIMTVGLLLAAAYVLGALVITEWGWW